MPDYIRPTIFDPEHTSGLYSALMDRMMRALWIENGMKFDKPVVPLTQRERDDTFYDAAKVGRNPEWDPEAPLVEHPARFLPDPIVVGQPDKARAVNTLLNYVPDLKRSNTKRVVMGPTEQVIRTEPSGGDKDGYWYPPALDGAREVVDGSISLHPTYQTWAGEQPRHDYPPEHIPIVLAHEFMHGRKWRDSDGTADYLGRSLPKNIRDLMTSIVTPMRPMLGTRLP